MPPRPLTPTIPPRTPRERYGWALRRGARDTWRAAAAAWREAPRTAFRRWAATILVGLVVACGLSALLTALAERWADGGGHARDEALFRRLVAADWMTFHGAMWWEGLGSSEVLLPVAVLAAVVAARAGRPFLALTFLAGYLLHKLIVFTGWQTWDRARPDLVAGGIAAPPLHSFPSGHAAQVVVVWGLLAWLWMRRSASVAERAVVTVLLAVVLALVGYARVRLGTHWPADIVAGSFLGLLWLLVCVLAQRRAEAAGGR